MKYDIILLSERLFSEKKKHRNKYDVFVVHVGRRERFKKRRAFFHNLRRLPYRVDNMYLRLYFSIGFHSKWILLRCSLQRLMDS